MRKFLVLLFALVGLAGAASAQTVYQIEQGVQITPCSLAGCTFTGPIVSTSTYNGGMFSWGIAGSSGGNVATTPGSGYAPGDRITLAGGTYSTVGVLNVHDTKAVSATVAAGGTGGTTGACTVTGTTGSGTRAQFSGTVSAGALTGPLTVVQAGDYTTNPTTITAEPVTGCGLSGAQVNMQLGVLYAVVNNPGVYSVVPATATQASTTGAGTGATFAVGQSGTAPAGAIQFAPVAAQVSFGGIGTGQNLFLGPPGLGSTITTGFENVGIGAGACGALTSGGENLCIGFAAGGQNQTGGGNVFIYCAPDVNGGNGNTCVGTDALRNAPGNTFNVTAIGNSCVNQQQTEPINNVVCVGQAALYWLNNGASITQSANITAVGPAACIGTPGASFIWATCLGGGTGGALNGSNALGFTLIGYCTGNSVFTGATDVLLIGTGFNFGQQPCVETPSATTPHYYNIANAIVGNTSPPTISSGFGTSPTAPANYETTAAFQLTVGTGGTATSGVLAFANAPLHANSHGYACDVTDASSPALRVIAAQTTTTTVTLTAYNSSGTATPFGAGDVLVAKCNGY